MKLKYKSIIIFIIIITTSSMPLSMYILNKESEDKIFLMKNQGNTYSRILSQLALNIVLMNGGDLKASSIDAIDMMSAIKSLAETGLIYSDVILVSQNPANNGYIFGKYINEKIINKELFSSDIISFEDIKNNKFQNGIEEVYISGLKDTGYQFISASSAPGKNTYYVGRLIFAKSMVLAPVARLRTIILIAMLGNLAINLILAVLLGRIIAKPIESLISEVEIIGSGDIDHRIKVTGKNEISKLATTFNHLAQVLELEINNLKSKNIELVRVNDLKDDFLANVTHELRTPLYGMIGLAESLMDGIAGQLEEKARYNLSLVINSGKRLTSLVNDILDYSQLKHGDITLNLSSINLHSIVKLIISISMPLIENKDLKIKTSIEPDSFYVNADENRLQQILLNVMGNAIKFTEYGEIEISAKTSPDNNDEIIVSIKDTGIGIAKEDQDRIFELFEQAGGSISKYKTGTGIGLSISKQLIELHGGKIRVDSEPNKGSCFSFTLKKSDKEAVFIKERASKFISGLSENSLVSINEDQIIPKNIDPDNKLAYSRIMIVDDEPVNCQVLINHLYIEGYIVIPVSNGQDALDKINAGQVPDLLILDVMLPVMSGYDVCRKIREKYSPGELPILMLTAKSGPGDLIIGFEAGTNDYLTKPVSKAELLARVNGLLQLKKSVKDRAKLNIINREISIAQNIQKSLLENKMPDIENVSLALRYFPMYEIGGDFYEISPIDENRIGILIADVSGHGIPAAFISGMLKVICNFHIKSAQNPAEFMDKINEAIYNIVEGQFITACYAIIDIKKRKIIQSNAGHWPTLIYRQSMDDLIINNFENKMPLGCALEEKYENIEFDLEINDRLIFYTDGIIELRNTEGKMFGDQNFHRLIKAIGNYELEDFADKIIETIKKWYNTSEEAFADDVTLLALDINNF
jgi:two-component system, sensor histidine kinase ChiS